MKTSAIVFCVIALGGLGKVRDNAEDLPLSKMVRRNNSNNSPKNAPLTPPLISRTC